MITCRDCSFELGSFNNFGFLEKQETRGKSYHFVAEKSYIEVLSNKLIFDTDITSCDDGRASYIVVRCSQCSSDVGKKFTTSSSEIYFAFGKEKIRYGDDTVCKEDKWPALLGTETFRRFERFDMSSFRDGNSRAPIVSSSSIYLPPNNSRNSSKSSNTGSSSNDNNKTYNRNSNNSSDNPTNRRNASRGFVHHAGRFESSSSRSGRGPPSRPPPSKGNTPVERPTVGTSLAEKIKFLQTKMSNWEPDKLVYELTGPNSANWQLITGVFIFFQYYFDECDHLLLLKFCQVLVFKRICQANCFTKS